MQGSPAGTAASAPSARGSAAPSSSLDGLNAKLKALLPHGEVVPGRVTPTLDPRSAVEEYEKALAPPAEVLAATFGLLRISRTLMHADSIAYVFERKRDILGREVCRAFRVTDHPPPPPPARFDPNRPLVFPDRSPDLKPSIEYVDVSCTDPRMQKVEPGSLKTPVPRHL